MKKLFLILVLASCSKTPAPATPPSFPVKTAKAIQKETPIFIETLGHVDSITSIDIRSRIEGELIGVHFKQGQEVKKDDLLFTVDPRPYEAVMKGVKATLDQNLASLSLAEEKVKRYKSLVSDEYFAQLDYETLQTNFAQSTALVAQTRAQLEQATLNLNFCWIYAPIDGKMGILKVDYGNLVTDAGTPLATLNQMAPIYVTFSIPEFQLPKVQKASTAQKSTDTCKPAIDNSLKVLAAYEDFAKDEIFEGSLYMIDNSVDPNTGMIKMRAVFQNEKRELWPGQFIRTRLVLDTIKDAVTIPYSAIQLTQSGPVVFVVKSDNTIEQRNVKLGQREDGNVMILSGINSDEKVVTEGQLNLSNGVRVYEPL